MSTRIKSVPHRGDNIRLPFPGEVVLHPVEHVAGNPPVGLCVAGHDPGEDVSLRAVDAEDVGDGINCLGARPATVGAPFIESGSRYT